MAKSPVYAVYDSKVNAFDKPFVLRSRGEALRGWETVVNDATTSICKYPEDFALMELGEYDDSTGQFSNHTAPINLGIAAQFKRAPETQAPLFDSLKGAK